MALLLQSCAVPLSGSRNKVCREDFGTFWDRKRFLQLSQPLNSRDLRAVELGHCPIVWGGKKRIPHVQPLRENDSSFVDSKQFQATTSKSNLQKKERRPFSW